MPQATDEVGAGLRPARWLGETVMIGPVLDRPLQFLHVQSPAVHCNRMPELPDIVVYIEALEKRILGETLEEIRIVSPFLLRTATPPITSTFGKKVLQLKRMGKRICIGLEADLWLVLHLMIAGRLHWREPGAEISPRQNFAAFDFRTGSLLWSEAGTKKRASLHIVSGEAGLHAMDPGGLEVLECTFEDFAKVIRSENHTLKRSLTDPRMFSGIGNAYSDEILFEAKLSPIATTQKLTDEDLNRLFQAVQMTLRSWIDRLRQQYRDKFPEKVTAFRPDMSVHGRYKQPCPRCNGPIQRIRYASNETNYCPACQTGGRLLADRALSRLLKEDWPKSIEELEHRSAASKTMKRSR
jgi:formamidopyrimidine-DNA glycosylase